MIKKEIKPITGNFLNNFWGIGAKHASIINKAFGIIS